MDNDQKTWRLESSRSQPPWHIEEWPDQIEEALHVPIQAEPPNGWTLKVWKENEHLLGQFLIKEAPEPVPGQEYKALTPGVDWTLYFL